MNVDVTGAQGPRGPPGPQGGTGADGDAGLRGPTGPQGSLGNVSWHNYGSRSVSFCTVVFQAAGLSKIL